MQQVDHRGFGEGTENQCVQCFIETIVQRPAKFLANGFAKQIW